jgi:hypothetical protein
MTFATDSPSQVNGSGRIGIDLRRIRIQRRGGSPGNAIETVNSHVRETRFQGRRKCNLPASLGKVIYGRSGAF